MMNRYTAVRLVLCLVMLGLLLSACRSPQEPELALPTEPTGTPVTVATEAQSPEPSPTVAAPTEDVASTVTAAPTASQSEPSAAAAEAAQAAFEGDYERAITLWRAIIDATLPAERVPPVLALGQVYLAAGRLDLAVAQASWAAAYDAPPALHAEALGLLGAVQEQLGDWQGTAETLAQYVAVDDLAAPYVWWRIAKAYKSVGDVSQQIAALERIETERLGTSFRAEVLAELASAYRSNNDPNSAIRIYDAILEFAVMPDYRALVTHYKGETLREASHEEDALSTFYSVANGDPSSFAAYLSLQELAALPEPPPTQEAATGAEGSGEGALILTDLTRGKIHYHAQEYYLALEYLNYHIDAEPERGAAEAHYYLGMTLAKQGQYEDALAHYDKAIESAGDQALLANAWLAKAWTIGASGSDPSGFYHEFYVNHPTHARAADALWEAALASEGASSWTQASTYYGLLAEKYPEDKRAPDAAFRQGLAAYAQRDPYTASTTWRAVLDGTEDPALRARLITWMGLAARQAGQLGQADVFWQEAVRISPNTYYGLRAADLLEHTMPRLASGVPSDVAIGLPDAEEWDSLAAWIGTWSPASSPADLAADPGFEEAAALQTLGWRSETSQSLGRLQDSIKDDPQKLLSLAKAAVDWQVYPSAIWCSQRVARLAREAGVAEPPEALLRLAYPNVYTELVAQYAQHYDLDPLLMLAVIRQESLFSPWARSYAGAVGLGQVMPDTGKWIASQIGPEDYSESLLLRPVLNLRYSAWFYELLLNLYDRDWIAALVAYNAGPGNLKTWTNGQPIEDHDLFYETLPSQQAQDYVRLIYEHYHWYQRLYRPDEAG